MGNYTNSSSLFDAFHTRANIYKNTNLTKAKAKKPNKKLIKH